MPIDSLDSIYSLPINSRHQEIIAAVKANQVTIITAETGAGKSTQVPQYLAEAGFTKVIVTQPRILAARSLSSRVRSEYSWRRGIDASELVGYRTAHEGDASPQNVILYCTDGLQLVRELTGNGINGQQVLILDEIHEWNENMEVLIAWAKKRCQEDALFKLVLMSATIEASSLARYFNCPAPITVEGRSFPVESRYATNLVETITDMLHDRTSNMLVFLPGKAEIEQIADALVANGIRIPILPLHSQLEASDQQRAFEHYPDGKVVLSTNIAQTSITIDDIDVVVDSGLERRAEVRNGVEGLFISEISQADCLQRAGRAGRVKPGIYVLARLGNLPCSPLEKRPEYGVPEIMRKHIDRLVLRLSNISIDIEDLEFFHAPSHNAIKRAKQTLSALGALEKGHVTEIGRRMERFPVESSYSRMMVEVEQYPSVVQSKLATIIAIQEVGGITKGGPRHTGWQRYTKQRQSDLLAAYDVLLSLPAIPEDEHEELGIITKNTEKATEIAKQLHDLLGLEYTELTPISHDEEMPLLRSIVAGELHQIWIRDPEGFAVDIDTKQQREISSTTLVRNADLFTGTPFDLQIPTDAGLETLELVNALTLVNPVWLTELAPSRFKIRLGKVSYDARTGTLSQAMQLYINGKAIPISGPPLFERTPANQSLFAARYSDHIEEQLSQQRRAYNLTNRQKIPQVSAQRIRERIHRIAPGAVSLIELSKEQRLDLQKLTKLETWLGQDFLQSLNPPRQERHWVPPHKRGHSHSPKPKHTRNNDWRHDSP
jgi:ATP-dependent RNA helicase DHX8/PRP22